MSAANDARRCDERINVIPMEIRIDAGKSLSVTIKQVRNLERIAPRLFHSRLDSGGFNSVCNACTRVDCLSVIERLDLTKTGVSLPRGFGEPAFAVAAVRSRNRFDLD